MSFISGKERHYTHPLRIVRGGVAYELQETIHVKNMAKAIVIEKVSFQMIMDFRRRQLSGRIDREEAVCTSFR